MRIDPGDRKYITWPVRGLPDVGTAPVVRFDGGDWVPMEFVMDGTTKVGVRVLIAGPDAAGEGAVPLSVGTHTVQLRLTDYPTIEDVTDAGEVIVGPVPAVVVEDFGVGWEEVVALAPHVSVSEQPANAADDVFGGSAQKVRTADVRNWIANVAAVVDARLAGRSSLAVQYRDAVNAAAKTIVLNGAASYLVSAAFPMKAGVNENTAYSAELWRRYEDGLTALAAQVDDWLHPDDGDPVVVDPAATATIGGWSPPTLFPDSVRWW